MKSISGIMIRICQILFILLFSVTALCGQDSLVIHRATRVSSAPKIDGVMDDNEWKEATAITEYFQF